MTRRAAVLLPLLLLPGLAAAADVFAEYGLDQASVEESLFQAILRGGEQSLPVTPLLRAVPPSARAKVVEALATVARSYCESDAFRARYESERKGAVPTPPEPARTGEQLLAAQKAEVGGAIAELEKNLELFPEEQREAMRSTVAELKKAQAQQADPALLVAMDKARYDEEMRAYKEALAELAPESPREAIKQRLQQLLKATAEVDFGAKLVESDGIRRFAKPEYEQKPWEWRLCFRIGKEATEAARAAAKAWLESLK